MPTPTGPGHPDVEAAVDALYQAPLDRFTAERNALAASLKKAGDKASADRVKALAKPSTTAWAVNQVWWRHRDRVQAMLDAGAAQRAAHIAWAQGRKVDVRAAGEARQHAVREVTEAALEVLGGRNAVAPDVQYRISGTVEALASGGGPEGDVLGRLTRDVQSTGLASLTALADIPDAAPRPTLVSRGEPTVSPVRAPRLADAQARADALASALEAATIAAQEAAAAEAQAQRALEEATRRRADLEGALDEARAAEASARRVVSSATAAASRAELDRTRAARDATRAREALEQLRKGP